jgi:hypothetical protein
MMSHSNITKLEQSRAMLTELRTDLPENTAATHGAELDDANAQIDDVILRQQCDTEISPAAPTDPGNDAAIDIPIDYFRSGSSFQLYKY